MKKGPNTNTTQSETDKSSRGLVGHARAAGKHLVKQVVKLGNEARKGLSAPTGEEFIARAQNLGEARRGNPAQALAQSMDTLRNELAAQGHAGRNRVHIGPRQHGEGVYSYVSNEGFQLLDPAIWANEADVMDDGRIFKVELGASKFLPNGHVSRMSVSRSTTVEMDGKTPTGQASDSFTLSVFSIRGQTEGVNAVNRMDSWSITRGQNGEFSVTPSVSVDRRDGAGWQPEQAGRNAATKDFQAAMDLFQTATVATELLDPEMFAAS